MITPEEFIICEKLTQKLDENIKKTLKGQKNIISLSCMVGCFVTFLFDACENDKNLISENAQDIFQLIKHEMSKIKD